MPAQPLPPTVERCVMAWRRHITTAEVAKIARDEAELAVIAAYQDGWDVKDVANLLHVHYVTLYRILKRHGITSPTN